MSKRSNKGKTYFYAMGQRDYLNGVRLSGELLRSSRKKLLPHARSAWLDGYYGF